jgi:hypothetical protein
MFELANTGPESVEANSLVTVKILGGYTVFVGPGGTDSAPDVTGTHVNDPLTPLVVAGGVGSIYCVFTYDGQIQAGDYIMGTIVVRLPCSLLLCR